MLSLAAPWWLLGLALLPAIRWLHRGGRHRAVLPVSHLGLWRGVAAHSPAAGQKQPPDPAWRRRALLAALMLLALAEPRLLLQQPAVTLWVDDSLSMLTLEAQGSRLAVGLAQAEALLAGMPATDLEVRTLGDPWQRLGTPGDTVKSFSAVGAVDAMKAAIAALPGLQARLAAPTQPAPTTPPAALLRGDRQHWLVTDGAHPALLQWPADRVLRVGIATRNVGVAHLAAGRSLQDADRLDILVQLHNGGDADETRELVIAPAGGAVLRSSHRLAPGASVWVTAQVTAQVPASDSVSATLQPADALAADDELVLDTAPLRRRGVVVHADCPAALQAAVATHPALVLAAPGAANVAAVLDCSGAGAADAAGARGDIATLRVQGGSVSRWPTGAVQWSAAQAAQHAIKLEAGRLPLAAVLKPLPGDSVLLAAGGEPVIVGRAGGRQLIETALDFTALAAARGADTPLLVNLMFERLLGARLLGAAARTGRGAAASSVVPAVNGAPVTAAASAASAASAGTAPPRTMAAPRPADDSTRPLLLLAVLALLWEVAALGRQWLRVGRPAQAGHA